VLTFAKALFLFVLFFFLKLQIKCVFVFVVDFCCLFVFMFSHVKICNNLMFTKNEQRVLEDTIWSFFFFLVCLLLFFFLLYMFFITLLSVCNLDHYHKHVANSYIFFFIIFFPFHLLTVWMYDLLYRDINQSCVYVAWHFHSVSDTLTCHHWLLTDWLLYTNMSLT
jgi:hypothetical protein